jgi:hypothetical protein
VSSYRNVAAPLRGIRSSSGARAIRATLASKRNFRSSASPTTEKPPRKHCEWSRETSDLSDRSGSVITDAGNKNEPHRGSGGGSEEGEQSGVSRVLVGWRGTSWCRNTQGPNDFARGRTSATGKRSVQAVFKPACNSRTWLANGGCWPIRSSTLIVRVQRSILGENTRDRLRCLCRYSLLRRLLRMVANC